MTSVPVCSNFSRSGPPAADAGLSSSIKFRSLSKRNCIFQLPSGSRTSGVRRRRQTNAETESLNEDGATNPQSYRSMESIIIYRLTGLQWVYIRLSSIHTSQSCFFPLSFVLRVLLDFLLRERAGCLNGRVFRSRVPTRVLCIRRMKVAETPTYRIRTNAPRRIYRSKFDQVR